MLLLRKAGLNWVDDRAASMGAAIACYTIFSFAPLLILVIAIAGHFLGTDAARIALFGELAQLVGSETAAVLQSAIVTPGVFKSGLVAGVVGIATLLVTASATFAEIQSAFNVIWQAAPPKGFGLWYLVRARLLSIVLVFVIGFLVLVSLMISATLSAFGAEDATTLLWINQGVSFCLTTVLFGAMFKVLPDAWISWGDVWLGAVVTAILFATGRFLIGLYIAQTNVGSAYGATGAIVIILAWIYYSAQIMLFGAELAKAYRDTSRRNADTLG